ncbi:T9SS type A sorting domain-containing protein [Flavobacterium sp. B17]|uniref:T9SS type A sorting domain-containing protein n=1 Tax=Flavobacterium sp. B17 TaxID=95618 RepID=UPI0005B2D845|nr:T9SS type A sorting domain-containing protein [Flavobacterium sp. B17]
MNSSVFTFATNRTDRPTSGNDTSLVKTEGPGNASQDFQYLLYPNPVKMNTPFTVKFPETENLEISIYDGGGRMVSSEKINSKANIYQNKLSIQGVYLVVLSQNKKLIKAFKVIVN